MRRMTTTRYVNGHITMKAPLLVRSAKLSMVELGEYLDG